MDVLKRYSYVLVLLACLFASLSAGIIPAIIPAAVPTANKTGTGSRFATATAAGVSGNCAQWSAGGDVGDAGAPCGAGGGGITQLTGDVTAGPGSGSQPATVARINGVALGSTTATSGNLLIGSGTQWITRAITGDFSITSLGVATVTAINGGTVPVSAKILGSNGSSQPIAAALTSAHLYVGNGSNLPADVAASGDVSLTNTGAFTVTQINGGPFPTSAKIVGSNGSNQPIAAALTSAHLYVGNISNVPVDVAVSGDVSLTNAGAFTVTAINGVALGSTTATANNVLVANGSQWATSGTAGFWFTGNLGGSTVASATTDFIFPGFLQSGPNAGETARQLPAIAGGTLTGFFVKCSSGSQGAVSATYTLRKNVGNTAINCTMSSGQSSCSSASTDTVSAQDLLSIQVAQGSGNATCPIGAYGFRVVP